MKKNLVSYNGRENFEVDLSSLKQDDLSVPGRVTLFVSRGNCWELTNKELELVKDHPCWGFCCLHNSPKGVNKPKEESETPKKIEKKTLQRKPSQ
jgi:hypothetical protein